MRYLVRDKAFYATFFRLALTIALQNVIVFGVTLADGIMLGRFSETAFSGVTLVNQVQFFLQMLIMGVTEGVVILGSRAWGKRDTQSVVRIAGIGLKFAIGIAALLWGLMFFWTSDVLSLLSNEMAVVAEGAKYGRIICFSYVFFAVTQVLIASLRSVETVKIGLAVSTITLLISVGLNYVLIFGNFGAPRLGAQGAAISTLIARIVETLVVVFFVWKVDRKLNMRLRVLWQRNAELLKNFVRVTWPVFLSNAFWGLAISIQTAILGRMGEATITANGIATTVFQIVSVVAYGSASATGVIIGKTIGEGRIEKIKPYAVTMQVMYVIIGLLSGVVLFALRPGILSLYSVSEEAQGLAMSFMTVLAVTIIGTSYQMPCLVGMVRAGGETNFVLRNDMIFMWGLVLPSALLAAFMFHWPATVVFVCLKADQVLKCLVAVVKVNRFGWVRDLSAPAKKPQVQNQ